jgi:hypothetical protein
MNGRGVFSFPDPVNEVSARFVAGGVVIMALATLIFGQPWLLVPLAYGFVARAASGPTLSPLGQFVTRVVTPRFAAGPRYVAGPPKRFAQAIGALITVSALISHFGFGATDVAYILVGLIAVAATLESVFAFCIGCRMFAVLMRMGLVSDSICERCNNIGSSSVERAHTRGPHGAATSGSSRRLGGS